MKRCPECHSTRVATEVILVKPINEEREPPKLLESWVLKAQARTFCEECGWGGYEEELC